MVVGVFFLHNFQLFNTGQVQKIIKKKLSIAKFLSTAS